MTDPAALPAADERSTDRIAALVVVAGGDGGDTLNVDDPGDTDGGSAVITDRSVTGLDMAPRSEVQQVRIDADSGSFTLRFRGQTTAPISITTFADGSRGQLPTAAAVRAALAALSTIGAGNVEVTLDVDTYTIRFLNDLAGINWGQVTIDGSNLRRLGQAGLVTLAASTVSTGASTAAGTSDDRFSWNEHQIVRSVGPSGCASVARRQRRSHRRRRRPMSRPHCSPSARSSSATCR